MPPDERYAMRKFLSFFFLFFFHSSIVTVTARGARCFLREAQTAAAPRLLQYFETLLDFVESFILEPSRAIDGTDAAISGRVSWTNRNRESTVRDWSGRDDTGERCNFMHAEEKVFLPGERKL